MDVFSAEALKISKIQDCMQTMPYELGILLPTMKEKSSFRVLKINPAGLKKQVDLSVKDKDFQEFVLVDKHQSLFSTVLQN